MKINEDIQGELRSAHISGPFDKAKEALERRGYQIISLEQLAGLRIQEGKDSFVSKNGNWTKEGFLYVPEKGIFLTKKSPIIKSAQKATECHRNKKDFYPTSKQVESALADSCKVTDKTIPTLKLSEEELTAYAFGKQAKLYGEFLNEAGIKNLHIYTADMQEQPFATQAWLGRLVFGSGLGGGSYCGWLLAGDDGARGVKENK